MTSSVSPRLSLSFLRSTLTGAALVCAALATGCSATTEEPGGDSENSGDSESAVITTVATAVSQSCATASVKGLSQQIIDEARCMNPDAFATVSKPANAVFGSGVFPYLEKPARDQLASALSAKSGTTMTVNSMLRTVAQQYLLYRWYQNGTCGIGLAAKPGNSNHETGLALDVSQYSTWKGTLQARGFAWLGSSDPVHFDYAGAGAVSYKGVDVKAFQRLWNRNHADDKISADGVWGPQTEARMKKAPAAGFALGATCGAAAAYDGDTEIALADDSSERINDSALALGDIFADDSATVDDVIDVEHAVAGGEHDDLHVASAEVDTGADDACASCFYAICEADAFCCETAWDDACIATGESICEALCGAEAMAPL